MPGLAAATLAALVVSGALAFVAPPVASRARHAAAATTLHASGDGTDLRALVRARATLHAQRAVLRANVAFYKAFSTKDTDRMARLWEDAHGTSCVHPGQPPLHGAGPIQETWSRMFAHEDVRFSRTSIAPSQQRITVSGDVAWVFCTEEIAGPPGGGGGGGGGGVARRMLATNVFRKCAITQRWLMVHHHASPPSAEASASAERAGRRRGQGIVLGGGGLGGAILGGLGRGGDGDSDDLLDLLASGGALGGAASGGGRRVIIDGSTGRVLMDSTANADADADDDDDDDEEDDDDDDVDVDEDDEVDGADKGAAMSLSSEIDFDLQPGDVLLGADAVERVDDENDDDDEVDVELSVNIDLDLDDDDDDDQQELWSSLHEALAQLNKGDRDAVLGDADAEDDLEEDEEDEDEDEDGDEDEDEAAVEAAHDDMSQRLGAAHAGARLEAAKAAALPSTVLDGSRSVLARKTIDALRWLEAEDRISAKHRRLLVRDVIGAAQSDRASNVETAYRLLLTDDDDEMDDAIGDFGEQARSLGETLEKEHEQERV